MNLPPPSNNSSSESDVESNILYQALINAKYEYLLHLSKIYIPRFIQETENYVFDTQHYYYKLLFNFNQTNPINEINHNYTKSLNQIDSEELRRLYKELILLVHPDKSQDSNTQDLFIEIYCAYKSNNIAKLRELHQYYQKNGVLPKEEKKENKIKKEENKEKEEKIKFWESQLWFHWFNPKSEMNRILKEIFIPIQELISKTKKENEELKKDLLLIQEKISKIRKDNEEVKSIQVIK